MPVAHSSFAICTSSTSEDPHVHRKLHPSTTMPMEPPSPQGQELPQPSHPTATATTTSTTIIKPEMPVVARPILLSNHTRTTNDTSTKESTMSNNVLPKTSSSSTNTQSRTSSKRKKKDKSKKEQQYQSSRDWIKETLSLGYAASKTSEKAQDQFHKSESALSLRSLKLEARPVSESSSSSCSVADPPPKKTSQVGSSASLSSKPSTRRALSSSLLPPRHSPPRSDGALSVVPSPHHESDEEVRFLCGGYL